MNFPTVAPEAVTLGDVESAAKTLGLKTVTAESIRAHRILGSHLAEIGVASVGRGVYLGTLESAQRAMEKIEGLLEKYEYDPDTVTKLLNIQAKFCTVTVSAAKGIIEAGDPKKSDFDGPALPPPPPTQIFVRGDNVSVSSQ